MILSLIPTIAKPAVELAFGHKSFPRVAPIVPKSLQNLETSEQVTDRTSSFAKWAGEKTGVSPIKIDYAVEGYGGRATKFATHLPELFEEPGKYFDDVANPFKQDKKWYGKQMQDYYKEKKEYQQLKNAKKYRSLTFEEKSRHSQLEKKVEKVEEIV
jgi:hypothetical protein